VSVLGGIFGGRRRMLAIAAGIAPVWLLFAVTNWPGWKLIIGAGISTGRWIQVVAAPAYVLLPFGRSLPLGLYWWWHIPISGAGAATLLLAPIVAQHVFRWVSSDRTFGAGVAAGAVWSALVCLSILVIPDAASLWSQLWMMPPADWGWTAAAKETSRRLLASAPYLVAWVMLGSNAVVLWIARALAPRARA